MPHIRSRSALVALAAAGGLALTGPAAGAATTLHASLSGHKEVPKAGRGSGSARIVLRPGEGRVCYRITVHHVGTMVMGHIHKGGKRVAGPIVIPLFESPTKHPSGCVSASKATIRAIARHPGRYYVNVHTAKFPAGAARGQLHR
jgi:CHRD domain-containing protein